MNVIVLLLVVFLGNGDDYVGFIYMVIMFVIIFCVLMFFVFKNICEMDMDKIQYEFKLLMKKSFVVMKGNWLWILMVLVNLIFWIVLQQCNMIIVYYLIYNFDCKDLVLLINSLVMIQILFIIVIFFFSKYLVKIWIWVGGLLVVMFGGVMMWLVVDNIIFFIVVWIFGNIGSGIVCLMLFVMLGFVVDFGVWKIGIKVIGIFIVFGSIFCIKMGSGFGIVFVVWIMNSFGYVFNYVQSVVGLEGIIWVFIWVFVLFFVFVVILLFFFCKYEVMEEKICYDLEIVNL